MRSKESGKVRYAYGVAMALLLGGTAFSLATGQAGAQVAQNAPGTSALAPRARRADVVRRPRRQAAAGGGQYLDQAKGAGQSADRSARGILPPVRPQSAAGRRRRQRQWQRQTAPSRAPAKPGSLGSGFIISPDGYIVTNNHLIQGLTGTGTVDTVTVTTTDRKEYTARIVGRDETSDLALLKIDGQRLPFVQWGDSTKARVGDWVIAIGDPYGVGSTVTAGIISALHRGITGVGAYDRYIQTDAAINMGNSGGPMFDLNGNVIGINSALISPTGASVGIGLAIPAEAAKPVIDSLMRGQRPSRGYLGVGLQPLDENLAPSARAAQGQRRDRPLGRPRRPGGTRRAPAGRRDRQGQRPAGHPGADASPISLPTRTVGSRVPLEIIRGGRRGDCHRGGRRTSDRGAAGQAQRRRHGHWGRPWRSSGGAAEGAWPVAVAAYARARARSQPAGDGARRDRHRGRSERQCGGAGPSARRSHRVGQQPAGDDSGAGDRGGRCGAQGAAARACCCWSSAGLRPRRSSGSTSAASSCVGPSPPALALQP